MATRIEKIEAKHAKKIAQLEAIMESAHTEWEIAIAEMEEEKAKAQDYEKALLDKQAAESVIALTDQAIKDL